VLLGLSAGQPIRVMLGGYASARVAQGNAVVIHRFPRKLAASLGASPFDSLGRSRCWLARLILLELTDLRAFSGQRIKEADGIDR
jgi:hypothetical protein